MTSMRILTFLLLTSLLSAVKLCGQTSEPFEFFKLSDYPKDKYLIKLATVPFGKLKIEIRQIKLLDDKLNSSEFYCRGWLTITQGKKVVKQLYFKSIEPVGGCSGLFIPDKQPRKDIFILSKFGDYDGRIFLIDTLGRITEKMGGIFSISKNKRFLFSTYGSDLSGLTVYDLNKKLILFSGNLKPQLSDWYFQDKKYFAVVKYDELANAKIEIATFNFRTKKIIITTADKTYPKAENKLNVLNDINGAKSCNCGR